MRTSPLVRLLTVAALAAPAAAVVQPYDFSDVTNLAAGALDGIGVDQAVPGFDLLLMKDGRVVYWQSFGVWSLNRVAAADSATKTLSGVLIMSLVDSSPQPFSLTTRLSDYIPAFGGPKQNITIGQCFSHTSGLEGSTAMGNQFLTLQQAAVAISTEPLAFVPGTMFQYGGSGMHAAGAAAELAGGQSWNDLFAARVAGPLNLSATRYVLTSPQNPRIAGGCESNATEFARVMEMLRRGGVHLGQRVLSESAVAAMFTRQPAAGIPIVSTPLESPFADGADYGVGVWLDERGPGGELLGAIAAGARGFSSWIDFDDGMVGVFATDRSAADNVQPLLYQIRAAAQAAVRDPIDCVADFNATGEVSVQDLFDYLTAFFADHPRADVNGFNGVTVQDLFDYLDAFFTGCF